MRKIINNSRFSIRLCNVADEYGFKTVGSMHKALKKANPNTKWYSGVAHIRGSRLIKELEDFLSKST
jgi:hypothetical protein